jgi:uncharacterized membrane protein
MTSAWLLSTVSLIATTVAALLIFLYLWKTPRLADAWQTVEGRAAYARHQRRLIVGVGLLAAWLVVQGAAVILI